MKTKIPGIAATMLIGASEALKTKGVGTDSDCTQTFSDGSSINMYYDPNTQLVNYSVTTPSNGYIALGYGSSMTNTDMSYWMASGVSSNQYAVYGEQHDTPDPSFNCYTNFTSTENADGTWTFTNTRILDCAMTFTYILSLDTEFDMISAWKTFLEGTTPLFNYHGPDNHVNYTKYLGSDGSCSSDPKPTPPAPVNNCELSFADKSTLNIHYDKDTALVNYDVVVEMGTYLALGYGTDMINTDMVYWSADGTNSFQQQVYSKANGQDPEPYADDQNCYTTTVSPYTEGDSTITFKSTRPLDCGFENSYNIPLDTEFNIINAWNPDDAALSFHGSNYVKGTFTLGSDGSCTAVVAEEDASTLYFFHGFLNWTAWCLISIAQIFTNRYLKHKWQWRQLVHSILGVFSLILFLTAGLLAFSHAQWVLTDDFHPKLGLACMVLGGLLCIGGIFTSIIKYKTQFAWKTGTKLLLSRFHGIFAWLMILLTNFTIGSGLYAYYVFENNLTPAYIMAFLSWAFIIFVLLAGECYYRRTLNKYIPFAESQITMSAEEFEQQIQKGAQLVILDDMVLDVSNFTKWHPGGTFVLNHNIGRDVSKFFYGGYSLDGNIGAGPKAGHIHSSYARMIINDLIIAKYDAGLPAETTTCVVREQKTATVNSFTKVFFLESQEGTPIDGFRRFYPGNDMLTKHFLVRSLDNPQVHRHYTTCNAMNPPVYQEYLRILKYAIENNNQLPGDLDKNLLSNENPSNQAMFTIKNYGQEGGVSKSTHDALDHSQFEVKGPMGKGLMPSTKGHHIAFGAGTGVLCFIDLVAMLIREVIGLDKPKESRIAQIVEERAQPDEGTRLISKQISETNSSIQGEGSLLDSAFMKLSLYVSFVNRRDSIGLELFETFQEYCDKYKKINFKLFVRLSDERVNSARWNHEFICNELEKFSVKKIQKVWVCGPPVMNETFDRCFDYLSQSRDLRALQKNQYEIL